MRHAIRPLTDDAFKVTLTGDAEQITASMLDVIEVEQPTFDPRHDPWQPALAFEQRQWRQIFAVEVNGPIMASLPLVSLQGTVGNSTLALLCQVDSRFARAA